MLLPISGGEWVIARFDGRATRCGYKDIHYTGPYCIGKEILTHSQDPRNNYHVFTVEMEWKIMRAVLNSKWWGTNSPQSKPFYVRDTATGRWGKCRHTYPAGVIRKMTATADGKLRLYVDRSIVFIPVLPFIVSDDGRRWRCDRIRRSMYEHHTLVGQKGTHRELRKALIERFLSDDCSYRKRSNRGGRSRV